MKNAPKHIYLQYFDEDGEPLTGSGDGVTWCEDKINDTDVKYVRVDEKQSKGS